MHFDYEDAFYVRGGGSAARRLVVAEAFDISQALVELFKASVLVDSSPVCEVG